MKEEVYRFLKDFGFSDEEIMEMEQKNDGCYLITVSHIEKIISFLEDKYLEFGDIFSIILNNPFILTTCMKRIEELDDIYSILGIDYEALIELCQKNNQMYTADPVQVQGIIDYLKSCGLDRKEVKKFIYAHPGTIGMPKEKFISIYNDDFLNNNENNLSYLLQLGYTDKQLEEYKQSWADGIIEYLSDYSDNVLANMKYLYEDFDKDLLLKLPVFYSDTFVMRPEIFKTRFDLLKDAFSDDYIDIVKNQFWSYDGFDTVYVEDSSLDDNPKYVPFLKTMAWDTEDVIAAIDSLKSPKTRIYKFIIMLNSLGLNITTEDIASDEPGDLLFLEVAKYEVYHNVESLMDGGLSKDVIYEMFWHRPDLFTYAELENTLIEQYGDDYADTMNELMENEELFDSLYEIW